MTTTRSSKIVVVAGDVIMDWKLTSSPLAQAGNSAPDGRIPPSMSCQCGGAALLADLIEKAAAQFPAAGEKWEVRRPEAPREPAGPNDPDFHHSFALWAETDGEKNSPSKERVWRVDRFFGLRPSILEHPKWTEAPGELGEAALVVIEDDDLTFRKFEESWPLALKTPNTSPWVLLKMSGRVVEGSLWRYLLNNHAERLVVLLKAEDLRKVRLGNNSDLNDPGGNNEVQISRGLSWEAAVEDLLWEINHNPTLKGLLRCVHLVVTFGSSGAILISRDLITPGISLHSTNTLIFDPDEIEDSWENRFCGRMSGGMTCVAAGLAREIMRDPADPNLERGLTCGLQAMRRLYEVGYRPAEIPGMGQQIQFPFEEIGQALAEDQTEFAAVKVHPPTVIGSAALAPSFKEAPYWTILGESNRAQGNFQDGDIYSLSKGVVLDGVESALRNVPIGRFRHLISVDRREIEGFRSIRSLISDYMEQENPGRPLSIAVFGAPGAGKSFGIQQVANSISNQIEAVTFNLSQFASQENLRDALHQVRDIALSGKIPLIFWDEFDTSFQRQPLGWLRFFLAPMQDGNFQDGQITHPLGRCIFIFAGGTCATMEAFTNRETDEERTPEQKKADDQAFRDVKGPDFVSRIKGFINMMGPNPVWMAGDSLEAARKRDPFYQIRRAVLMRSLFERKVPHLFNRGRLQIDQGLLRAFLQAPEYIHGARSIESLIDMSALNDKTYFDRSSLPVPALLNLHVEADKFIEIMQTVEFKDQDLIARMAQAVHEAFCHQLREEGYRYGPDYSLAEKKHPALLDYDDPRLEAVFLAEGKIIAGDIVNKLERLGYRVRQARSVLTQHQFSADEIEQMAHWEQMRWMIAKLRDGWKWAPQTNPHKKESNTMMLWEESDKARMAGESGSGFTREQMDEFVRAEIIGRGLLPENEKEIYRLMVREIPVLLAKAGCTVQKKDQ